MFKKQKGGEIMKYEDIKKSLLEDREFREELFKLYYEDDERFINKTIKEVSENKSNTSEKLRI